MRSPSIAYGSSSGVRPGMASDASRAPANSANSCRPRQPIFRLFAITLPNTIVLERRKLTPLILFGRGQNTSLVSGLQMQGAPTEACEELKI